jgi:hypothetical protein
MNYIAMVALLGWLPFVVLLFNLYPPKKLVSLLYVFAWLFLPEGGFALPGVPDYTKMSGTVVGILLSAFLFDSGRFLTLRPRWIDLPMVIYCFCNIPTTATNGLTTWDALSSIMAAFISWGLPYLVGRVYLTDLESFADLARAITIGGLLYVPLCLLEMRLSPVLSGALYGYSPWEGIRYGGFRPRVFLNNGLALSAWMMNVAIIGYALWSSGVIKSIRGVPFAFLALTLVATSVLCKSTGATILMATGLAIYWVSKRTKLTIFLWLAVAVPPVYCTVRTLDLWSGQELVQFFRENLNEERAQSLE